MDIQRTGVFKEDGMATTKMRKELLALVALVAALAMSVTLSGCGPSDEDAIKQALDDEMSIIVNPTDETISMLADEASSGAGGTLETMGIDSGELVRSWIDGFGYEVGTISVDGETATAEVTITCKQLGPIMMDWQSDFEANATSQGFTSMSEIYDYAGQTIMEKIASASPTETTVTFEFEKDGSNWAFPQSTANESALMDAMIGDYTL